jgi:hypothetical protein
MMNRIPQNKPQGIGPSPQMMPQLQPKPMPPQAMGQGPQVQPQMAMRPPMNPPIPAPVGINPQPMNLPPMGPPAQMNPNQGVGPNPGMMNRIMMMRGRFGR